MKKISKNDIREFLKTTVDDIVGYHDDDIYDNLYDYIDSLDVITIIFAAEEEFKVQLEDSALDLTCKLEDYVDLFYNKIK